MRLINLELKTLTKSIDTRSKKLLVDPGITTRNKKLRT